MNRILKYTYLVFFILFSVSVYFLTIRGNIGIPNPQQIEFELNSNGSAFETSQERSRYAMILSLYYDHTVSIDRFASMGTPDIGYINGHYYSFFPLGASVVALPLYIWGLQLGATQMMTFLVSTIFAFLTMMMIIAFCRKLKLHWSAALFAALAFGFATNAWGYSVTFYAHLISAFLLLSALKVGIFWTKRPALATLAVFLLYAVAVFIDFPNLFLFFPIAVYSSWKLFDMHEDAGKYLIKLRPAVLIGPFIFIGLMCLYGYYNKVNFGSPTTLSNAIPRVQDLKDINRSEPESGREAVSALQTRNMLEGFTSFTVSQDRGVLIYSPVVALAIFGLNALRKKQKKVEVLLLTTAGTCLVLYTMFGDPYGGWAFGSRYMIAILPELCIIAAIGLQRFKNKFWRIGQRVIASAVFIYSAAVSALAPLTTNVIPPYVEARGLLLDSDYRINWKMLQKNELNSFVFNHLLDGKLTGMQYYLIVVSLVVAVGLILINVPKPYWKGEDV